MLKIGDKVRITGGPSEGQEVEIQGEDGNFFTYEGGSIHRSLVVAVEGSEVVDFIKERLFSTPEPPKRPALPALPDLVVRAVSALRMSADAGEEGGLLEEEEADEVRHLAAALETAAATYDVKRMGKGSRGMKKQQLLTRIETARMALVQAEIDAAQAELEADRARIEFAEALQAIEDALPDDEVAE